MTRAVLLHVLAAASLTGAFTDLGHEFERAHPDVRVLLDFAGTPQLVMQVEQGAPADVFASADERWMSELERKGRVAGHPAIFARNRLVVIVPKANRAKLGRLQDLARPGVRIVLGAETVPVGRYARAALRNLAASPGFPSSYEDAVRSNVVSEEEDVKAVVGRVQFGEADAGICYRSDLTPAVAAKVRVIEIPDSANVIAAYPIARVSGARSAAVADDFVRFVLSDTGRRVLAGHGFAVEPRAP